MANVRNYFWRIKRNLTFKMGLMVIPTFFLRRVVATCVDVWLCLVVSPVVANLLIDFYNGGNRSGSAENSEDGLEVMMNAFEGIGGSLIVSLLILIVTPGILFGCIGALTRSSPGKLIMGIRWRVSSSSLAYGFLREAARIYSIILWPMGIMSLTNECKGLGTLHSLDRPYQWVDYYQRLWDYLQRKRNLMRGST